MATDEITLSGVLVGALTAGLGLVGKEIGEYLVKKQLEEHDNAYLAAVDLLTTIPAVERVFEGTMQRSPPKAYDDLLQYPRTWTIRPPSFDIKTLTAFDDVELDRELILIGDRHAAFAASSTEHAALYDWLLEHGVQDWNVSVASRDHVLRLDSHRHRLASYAREILRHSYSSLRRILDIAERWVVAKRHDKLLGLMTSQYSLSVDLVTLAASYYRIETTQVAFNPKVPWTTIVSTSEDPIDVEFDLTHTWTRFPQKASLRPREPIAVPMGIKITGASSRGSIVRLSQSEIQSTNQVQLQIVSR